MLGRCELGEETPADFMSKTKKKRGFSSSRGGEVINLAGCLPRSGLGVVYVSGNMAATKQIIEETLLKCNTAMDWAPSPNTPMDCGAPALFSATVGSYRAPVLKCVLIEPAGHSLHCGRNVWLPVHHRNPPFLCSGGQSSSAMCVEGLGGGRGVSGGTDICS